MIIEMLVFYGLVIVAFIIAIIIVVSSKKKVSKLSYDLGLCKFRRKLNGKEVAASYRVINIQKKLENNLLEQFGKSEDLRKVLAGEVKQLTLDLESLQGAWDEANKENFGKRGESKENPVLLEHEYVFTKTENYGRKNEN